MTPRTRETGTSQVSQPRQSWRVRGPSSRRASRITSDMSLIPYCGQTHYYSSVLDTNCVSNLNQEDSAWIPRVSDAEQWLEIDMGRSRYVCGVTVAGHPLDDAWVTGFRVLTSTTKGFQQDVAHYVAEPDVFTGCVEKDTEVEV